MMVYPSGDRTGVTDVSRIQATIDRIWSTEDGAATVKHLTEYPEIYVLSAPPRIRLADELVQAWERGEQPHVSYGDGIVTFHAKNGDVTYGLLEHNDVGRYWVAVRAPRLDTSELVQESAT